MRTLLPALLLLLLATAASARDAKPDDFAYGIPLRTEGTDALRTLPVPPDVYRGVTNGGLDDVCVFNGRGEVVPFSLSGPDRPAPEPAEFRTLPLFPLTGERERGGERVSLRVKKGPGDSILSVETVSGEKGTREISSYLVDASALKRPVSALALEWKPLPEGTVGRVRVEGSDDLEHWRVLVPDAPILDLRYGDHELSRRTVEMGSAATRYYRISTPDRSGMPILSSVTARLAPKTPELPRQWGRVAAVPAGKGSHEYLFHIPGRMPVDRVRVTLPQENTLVRVTLFSREREGDPWREDGSDLAFRLRIRGEELAGPDIGLRTSTGRYRMIRVDPEGGGLGSGAPVIEYGWVPDRLLFVARGGGPFILAYGSARTGLCPRSGDDLFRRLADREGRRYAPGQAAAGAPVILGGARALRRPLLPEDPGTTVLWALLVLAVALLAWMAWRLHGRMENPGDDGRGGAADGGNGERT